MNADKPPPSSMKISILSPNRPGYSREPPPPPIALSTSLSRRLSNSRSIKGGASPAMFPVTGKKRGCGFDNPEPSSPKVTCIGQVRVKSKKKYVKNIRGSLSRRRKLEHSRSQRRHVKCLQMPQRNSNRNGNGQRWVHIPPTICEAVSCLFPCRPSCWSTENEEKIEEERKHGWCGAVAGRWLVALQDGDVNVGDRREIELVKGEDDENEMDVGNPRRHVFDDLEIVNDVILGSKDEARVSICVPPKNALLLMRCRSDPLKMEALTNRFWEPTLEINEEKYENEGEESGEICQEEIKEDGKLMVLDEIKDQEQEQDTEEINSEMEMKQSIEEEDDQEQSREINEEEEESFFLGDLFEENADKDQEIEEEEEEEAEDCDMEDAQEELVEDEDVEGTETGKSNIEKVKQFGEGFEEMLPEFTAEILEETYEEIEAGESSKVKVKQFEEMLTEFKKRSGIPEETYEEIEAGESNIEKVIHFEEKTDTGESNIEKVKQLEEETEEEEEMLTGFKERSEIPEETYKETETGESNLEEVKQLEEEIEEMLTEFKERSDIPEETYEETETGESNLEEVKQLEEEIEEMLTEFKERSENPEETYKETETGESNLEEIIHFEEETKTGESNIEKVKQFEDEIEEMLTELKERSEIQEETYQEIEALPECLLLMMYDPKLSMEVSKETWVSSSDFSRPHSRKKPTPPPPGESIDDNATKMAAAQHPPASQKPARSSRSFPASRSMIAVLEEKLLNTMGIEPLVLSRCKSEPLRTAAARFAPESCCWQNHLEPPRRASFGVGMAGLGFCQFGS